MAHGCTPAGTHRSRVRRLYPLPLAGYPLVISRSNESAIGKDKICQSAESSPEHLHSRISIAFSAHEATQLCNLAYGLSQAHRPRWEPLPRVRHAVQHLTLLLVQRDG